MFEAVKYLPSMQQEWDSFVESAAVNGTFLQTRNFLNYHPEGRFRDCSVMLKDKDFNVYAVVPACEIYEDEKKVFCSHKGSTFGGIVINEKYYDSAQLQQIILMLEEFLKKDGFQRILLKITPSLFSRRPPDLMEYMLHLNGYGEYSELSTYIDYGHCHSDIVSNFNANKRKLVKKMSSLGLEFREIHNDADCADFYKLLVANLKKHGATPIHTLEEILDFKNNRLCNSVKFYGVFQEGVQLAGGMMFDFSEIQVVHAQNLSTDPERIDIDAITYLYYSLIKEYKEKGYRALSWGISTEDKGSKLNYSLIRNKEAYGSTYSLNRTFFKDL